MRYGHTQSIVVADLFQCFFYAIQLNGINQR
jgi:hypothetical protein